MDLSLILKDLRMQEVFKKPRAKDGYRSLWQSSDGSPCLPLALRHSKLLKRHPIMFGLFIKKAKW